MRQEMDQFNVGVRIQNEEEVVVEVLQKYKNGNVKFKVIENPNCQYNDFEVGKIYYRHSADDNLVRGDYWEFYEESPKNISPESIKEMESRIVQAEKIAEDNRKNVQEMRKTLEQMKKKEKTKPILHQLYEIDWDVCFCISDTDNVWTFMKAEDPEDGFFALGVADLPVVEIKHLNKPNQKKMAKTLSDFFSVKIPKD
jgi:hypothetical protein